MFEISEIWQKVKWLHEKRDGNLKFFMSTVECSLLVRELDEQKSVVGMNDCEVSEWSGSRRV